MASSTECVNCGSKERVEWNGFCIKCIPESKMVYSSPELEEPEPKKPKKTKKKVVVAAEEEGAPEEE